MGVASGCGEQEAGVASGSGWNLWVWLLGVVVSRYIDFLILLIPIPPVSVLFFSIPTFCSFFIIFLHHMLDLSVYNFFKGKLTILKLKLSLLLYTLVKKMF